MTDQKGYSVDQASTIIIVDSNIDYVEELQQAAQDDKVFEILGLKDGIDAPGMLAGLGSKVMAMFVSLSAGSTAGLIAIKACLLHNPFAKIFLIRDDSTPVQISIKEFQLLGINEVIRKPILYSQIIRLATTGSMKNLDAMGEAIEDEDPTFMAAPQKVIDYTAILAEHFLYGSISTFDVFIKLPGAGRYVKLLQQGDHFSPDRIDAYIKKGVKALYIRTTDMEKYTAYSDDIATAVVRQQSSIDAKISHILKQGEQALSFMTKNGITEENMRYASSFVKNVKEVISKMDPAKNQNLVNFLSNTDVYSHGVTTSMYAGALANVLEIRFEKPVQIVGLASLLHDIGLAKFPELRGEEDESKMTKEQKAMFRLHPEVGAEMLLKIPKIDRAVIQAVAQHHRRVDGSGFPEVSSRTNINVVAQIVGICDELDHVVRKARLDPSINILNYLEEKVLKGFSRQVVYGFRSTFFPKK